jgi:peroxidase
MSKTAKVAIDAYKNIVKKENVTALSYRASKLKVPSSFCKNPPAISCNDFSAIYRKFDGSCNNNFFSWYGKSETSNKRLISPAYDDYVSSPRERSVQAGKLLPNPRKVAMSVFESQMSKSDWSTLMTFFGQYIDHDVTLTAQLVSPDGFRKFCPCNTFDSDCFNIPIPHGDYVNNDQTCMSFVRSLPSINVFSCALSFREQLNIQTSWLDLSQLYGNNLTLANKLRDVDGKLKVSLENGDEFLPFDGSPSCNNNKQAAEYSRRRKCLLTGDPRTEDNVILTSLQTIFLREHNRIATVLKFKNPRWSSDLLYQTTRKIVVAEYNNIVYGEFLPSLLGTELAKRYGLLPNSEEFFTGYDPQIYPQVINEFATAAFRYGHTQMAYSLHGASRTFKRTDPKPISHYLFNNQHYRSSFDDVVRGLLIDNTSPASSHVNSYLDDYLFNGLYLKDSKRWSLPALNIQRGRDHGIPGYNLYREKCGLSRANKFEDLTNMPKSVIGKLKALYASPDDIDLFVGLVSEYPMENAMVGSTAGCKLQKHFFIKNIVELAQISIFLAKRKPKFSVFFAKNNFFFDFGNASWRWPTNNFKR